MNIKPCPFCGGENIDFGDNWSSGDAYVHCFECGGHMQCDEGDELDAIRKWNKRTKGVMEE